MSSLLELAWEKNIVLCCGGEKAGKFGPKRVGARNMEKSVLGAL